MFQPVSKWWLVLISRIEWRNQAKLCEHDRTCWYIVEIYQRYKHELGPLGFSLGVIKHGPELDGN